MTRPRLRAIYAGSFDPPTNGHVDIIERSAALFGELVVAVGHNPAKRSMFDIDERIELVQSAVAHVDGVVGVVRFSGLLVHAAEEHGATLIVRGIRTIGDFDLEFRNGLGNRDLSGIETALLLADPAHAYVSSSLVKEIANHGGDVSRYLPEGVSKALKAKLRLP